MAFQRWLINGRRVPSLVRRVQRGFVTIANGVTTGTDTITAVSVENAELVYVGTENDDASANVYPDLELGRLTFTNSTTITASRAGSTGVMVVNYEVLEYHPYVVKSIQRGTLALVTNGDTATITAIDVTKSRLTWLGESLSTVATSPNRVRQGRLTLTNATTITGNRNAAGATGTINIDWQVVEFF